MSYPIPNESLFVVLSLIQSDNMSNTKVSEHLKIVFWTVSSFVDFVVDRSHEGNELSWNCPIQVTILHFFIIFVLFWVEDAEVVPTQSDSNFESLHTMKYSAIVVAVSV